MKAKFTLLRSNPRYILIRDECNKYNTKSITNDAEAVVTNIYENFILTENVTLYYIDTMGYVDILEHDGKGNFLGFKNGYNSYEDFKKKMVI